MAVTYKIVNRADPASRENGKEYPTPLVKPYDKVLPGEFLKIMAEKTRFHKVTLSIFLYHFEAIIAELLKEGKIIQVENIGTFYPVVKYRKNLAEKTGKPEDMELTVRFRPSMDLKERLSEAKVVRVKG
jgi:nucleoid DNA-binding protein